MCVCVSVCVLLCFVDPILGNLTVRAHSLSQGTWGCRILTLHLNYVAGYTGALLFLFERTHTGNYSVDNQGLVPWRLRRLGRSKVRSDSLVRCVPGSNRQTRGNPGSLTIWTTNDHPQKMVGRRIRTRRPQEEQPLAGPLGQTGFHVSQLSSIARKLRQLNVDVGSRQCARSGQGKLRFENVYGQGNLRSENVFPTKNPFNMASWLGRVTPVIHFWSIFGRHPSAPAPIHLNNYI